MTLPDRDAPDERPAAPSRYTQVPRPTLWLVQETTAWIGGGDSPASLPRSRVDVASFYIGKSLVTNAHYEAFDPSHSRCDVSSGDDEPVVNVSLGDAAAYCEWYAKLSGKPFRLPTEIEWEVACRGGRATRYPWGDDASAAARFAWLAESSGGRTHDVETLAPNGAGVHDVVGLAWEWVAGEVDASYGVLRGGSFRTRAEDIACWTRRVEGVDMRADDVSFRIVRSL